MGGWNGWELPQEGVWSFVTPLQSYAFVAVSMAAAVTSSLPVINNAFVVAFSNVWRPRNVGVAQWQSSKRVVLRRSGVACVT